MKTFAMTEMETIRWMEANKLAEISNQFEPITAIIQRATDLFKATLDNDARKKQLQIGYIMQSLTLLCALMDVNLTECYAIALQTELDAEKKRKKILAQLHVVD